MVVNTTKLSKAIINADNINIKTFKSPSIIFNKWFSGLQFLIIFHLIISTCTGFEIFFPQELVKLTIPKTERAFKSLTKVPIGKFQVISLNRNNPASEYLYKFEEPIETQQYLRIDNKTGEVYLGNNFYNLYSNYNNQKDEEKIQQFTITAYNPKHDTFHMAHMTLQIELYTETKDFCAHQLNKICFWDNITYSIAENSKSNPIIIGEIGSFGLQYICSQDRITYSLNNKNQFIELDGRNIIAKIKLDHDSHNPGHSIDLLIKCSIKTSMNSVPQDFEKNIKINVLDRNDNGVWFQENKTYYSFTIPNPHFNEDEIIGDLPIIIRDNDSLQVNSKIIYEIHNETSHIIKPYCNPYEADHTGVKSTAISCQFKFIRRGSLRDSPHCFIFEARDMSLDTENTKDKRSINATICISSNMEKIIDLPGPKALAMTSRNHGNINTRRNRKLLRNTDEQSINDDTNDNTNGITTTMRTFIRVEYPKDIYVYRTSMNLTRVTQPSNMKQLYKRPDHKFSLIDDPTNAFAITKFGGILYVHNTTALMTAIEHIYYIKIGWLNETKVLFIHLEYGRPENTSCAYEPESRVTQTCSQVKTRKNCIKFCGLGTGGGSCEYRGLPNSTFSTNFATCTPNATYCPDNICDPLEQIDIYLCPQDCMPATKIFGPHTNNKNKLGIYSASGACICDEGGSCNCGSFGLEDKPKNSGKKKERNKIQPSQNVTEATTRPLLSGATIECGPSCMILAVGCPLILIIIVICLIISRRKYIKQAKRKVLSEKGDGENRTVDLPLVPFENDMKLDITSDSKWEFKRDLLVFDTLLGEGEFGKVLRGYATDIAGKTGITTVAVKMLKTGANSAEYLALLSEFQLLQECSHPNVIKLLGACTKGESPLLIIEYAKYGSLRSYLRLSRKIECSGVEFTDGVEPVTVKDILSFAWQICKGMAYLTEIKLVHRDLAARNVLLAEGKICKISDFGLTRDVYEDDAYLKRSRDRVPVKWMAPESLADHVYTTKSDVWAFGVLGWELITLGASPYPGIPPQNLYHLLKSGYRMERPENCSEDIYGILRACWGDDPNTRPSFKYLASQWEKLLGNNAKYLELETTSAVSNPLYCDDPTTQNHNTSTTIATTIQITGNNNTEPINKEPNESLIKNDLGEPDCLDHLWKPPKVSYEINDNNSNEENNTLSTCLSNDVSNSIQLGYDIPRPLIESKTTEQALRYENDLRFPLNIKICNGRISQHISSVPPNHYSVPVKRGRSYMDMTNKTLIPDNLNIDDFEKKMSKNITFRFSSLLNLNEQDTTVV
ncbi:uncharacterized protein LOC129615054 [Condylostylus longicornis]|uniref:uncharacterized protein LOC129615054 n=1 Tax=Condylostylus longicornis TaxID=2530218 RepID=UPI00244DC1CB|nr:uncharacterized protein LOC129615054 [Condylostylus longicornis]XP_055386080.1 uncharacterized protein LOC129615054 [Condylostylus longicornis]